MKIKFIIDRFEGESAILKSEDGIDTIVWPKSRLPEGAKESDMMDFDIQDDETKNKEKKELAREILNEIFNEEDIDENTKVQ